MEELGFIHREVDPHDKRSVKIFLTEEGQQKRKIAKKVIQSFNDYLSMHINDQDRLQLISMLIKINQLTLAYKPKEE